jgi:hypothetical protein
MPKAPKDTFTHAVRAGVTKRNSKEVVAKELQVARKAALMRRLEDKAEVDVERKAPVRSLHSLSKALPSLAALQKDSAAKAKIAAKNNRAPTAPRTMHGDAQLRKRELSEFSAGAQLFSQMAASGQDPLAALAAHLSAQTQPPAP